MAPLITSMKKPFLDSGSGSLGRPHIVDAWASLEHVRCLLNDVRREGDHGRPAEAEWSFAGHF